MFCSSCGVEIKNQVNFCPKCGAKIVSIQESAPVINNVKKDGNTNKKGLIGLAIAVFLLSAVFGGIKIKDVIQLRTVTVEEVLFTMLYEYPLTSFTDAYEVEYILENAGWKHINVSGDGTYYDVNAKLGKWKVEAGGYDDSNHWTLMLKCPKKDVYDIYYQCNDYLTEYWMDADYITEYSSHYTYETGSLSIIPGQDEGYLQISWIYPDPTYGIW